MRKRIADRFRSEFKRISPCGHCASRRRLRLSVNADNAAHVHLVRPCRAFHQFGRTTGSGHDPCTHIGEIGFPVILMVEHGNEHGRNAVETGDPFLIDTGKGVLGRKIRKGTKGRPVRHGSRHGKNHAEAMEHRHLNHHPVRG